MLLEQAMLVVYDPLDRPLPMVERSETVLLLLAVQNAE